MATDFSDAWIDELGARLRHGITPAARAAYEAYRQDLSRLRYALEDELRVQNPGSEVGSRTKRVETVAAKLQRRPEMPLSQVTDLVGCRIIVAGLAEQRAVADQLMLIYDVQQVDDKSDTPKFGYRAVHLDIRYRGQLMEIQVQTRNQHRWQWVSEEAASYDAAIKYGGGGHPEVGQSLLELSDLAYQCDRTGQDLPDDAVSQARNVIALAYAGRSG